MDTPDRPGLNLIDLLHRVLRQRRKARGLCYIDLFPANGMAAASENLKAAHVVLYIDDSAEDHLLFIKAVLRAQVRFHVQPFLSHDLAIKCLHRKAPFEDQKAYPCPDLILCDYDLGVSKGSEVVSLIRAIPGCADLPIIIFSATTGNDVINACYSAGAHCFLVKPSDFARWPILVKELHAFASSTPRTIAYLHRLEECRIRPPTPSA